MNMSHERTALARAEFFLGLAENCAPEHRKEFEAFLEASIVFARTAIQRMKEKFESESKYKIWLKELSGNVAVEFFRENRDFILKEDSMKIGQIITFNPIENASQLYYIEEPSVTATETVRKYFELCSKIITEKELLLLSKI